MYRRSRAAQINVVVKVLRQVKILRREWSFIVAKRGGKKRLGKLFRGVYREPMVGGWGRRWWFLVMLMGSKLLLRHSWYNRCADTMRCGGWPRLLYSWSFSKWYLWH